MKACFLAGFFIACSLLRALPPAHCVKNNPSRVVSPKGFLPEPEGRFFTSICTPILAEGQKVKAQLCFYPSTLTGEK
jgi:hypothetical protein